MVFFSWNLIKFANLTLFPGQYSYASSKGCSHRLYKPDSSATSYRCITKKCVTRVLPAFLSKYS